MTEDYIEREMTERVARAIYDAIDGMGDRYLGAQGNG